MEGEELTVEQWMERNPYFKRISNRILFTTEKEVDELESSEKIVVDSKEVSIEFLKRILNNDLYYNYASRYFNGEIERFDVAFIVFGDLGHKVSYPKSIIIKGIDQLIASGELKLEPFEQQRLDNLRNSITFDKFIEKHRGEFFDVEIDGNNYSFPADKLFSLMQLSDEQFDEFCSNPDNKDVNGIPNKFYAYAAFKFFKKNEAMSNYLLPDNVANHYREIGSLQKIDIEAINKLLETRDTKFQNIQIDSNLEHEIVSGIPLDATDLEKAIYIYIKMCKLFTYDEEYFAVNQKGPATLKHKNTDFVSEITLDDNEVVCFEFNLMYSKLLNDLGIHFISDYKNMLGEAYGSGHASLEFRTDKFLVNADSVTSILQGDIMQAKLNQPLVGLTCLNKNEQTQREFKEALTRMYQLVAEQDKSAEKYQVEHRETLDELLHDYSQVTDNIRDISLNERLSILVNKVNSTKMVGIDSLSYVLQLRKILFTEEQRDKNIKVTIVRNNEPFTEGKVAMASAIFTLNTESFEEHPEKNEYYYFNPNHELVKMSKEQLQTRFDERSLEYIDKDDPKIPGISDNGGIKR